MKAAALCRPAANHKPSHAGTWRVACGVWRAACGVWRVACGVSRVAAPQRRDVGMGCSALRCFMCRRGGRVG